MSRWWLAAALAGCASGPHSAVQPHADSFVKKGFGFAGPRALALIGTREDLDGMGAELKALGFTVSEVAAPADAATRYVAEVGGICSITTMSQAAGLGNSTARGPKSMHVIVTKTETGERVFSAWLADGDDCPASFYRDAADAIARNWPTPRL